MSLFLVRPSRREIDRVVGSSQPFRGSCLLILRHTIHIFVARNLAGRSASITYHLILSLVPILGIAFTFFKAFGGLENLLEESVIPKITSYFDPAVSVAMGRYLQNFVANMQTGTLGVTALLTLLLTIVALMGATETAFNEIVETRHERPWLQRLLNYWLLITLTPFVAVVSIVKSTELLEAFSGYLPAGLAQGQHELLRLIAAYLVEACGFSILYYVLPARRVTAGAAALGGAFAALGFESLQWVNGYVTGRLIHEASLLQLYGSVPVIIVVLFIWMRLVAVVLLAGMAFASAVNRVLAARSDLRVRRVAPAQTLVAHVLGFAWVLQSFRQQRHGATVQSLCRHLNLSRSEALGVLAWFEQAGCVWSHKEGGRLHFMPTHSGLQLGTDPLGFVRSILQIVPRESPLRIEPEPHAQDSLASRSRFGFAGLDSDIVSEFVEPALVCVAPLLSQSTTAKA
jgi:YihY family inner membrane protein